MTEKVITITYTFDKHGNPKGIGLNLDGDNVLVEDKNYLAKFIQDVEDDDKLKRVSSKKDSGLELVKK